MNSSDIANCSAGPVEQSEECLPSGDWSHQMLPVINCWKDKVLKNESDYRLIN